MSPEYQIANAVNNCENNNDYTSLLFLSYTCKINFMYHYFQYLPNEIKMLILKKIESWKAPFKIGDIVTLYNPNLTFRNILNISPLTNVDNNNLKFQCRHNVHQPSNSVSWNSNCIQCHRRANRLHYRNINDFNGHNDYIKYIKLLYNTPIEDIKFKIIDYYYTSDCSYNKNKFRYQLKIFDPRFYLFNGFSPNKWIDIINNGLPIITLKHRDIYSYKNLKNISKIDETQIRFNMNESFFINSYDDICVKNEILKNINYEEYLKENRVLEKSWDDWWKKQNIKHGYPNYTRGYPRDLKYWKDL